MRRRDAAFLEIKIAHASVRVVDTDKLAEVVYCI